MKHFVNQTELWEQIYSELFANLNNPRWKRLSANKFVQDYDMNLYEIFSNDRLQQISAEVGVRYYEWGTITYNRKKKILNSYGCHITEPGAPTEVVPVGMRLVGTAAEFDNDYRGTASKTLRCSDKAGKAELDLAKSLYQSQFGPIEKVLIHRPQIIITIRPLAFYREITRTWGRKKGPGPYLEKAGKSYRPSLRLIEGNPAMLEQWRECEIRPLRYFLPHEGKVVTDPILLGRNLAPNKDSRHEKDHWRFNIAEGEVDTKFEENFARSDELIVHGRAIWDEWLRAGNKEWGIR